MSETVIKESEALKIQLEADNRALNEAEALLTGLKAKLNEIQNHYRSATTKRAELVDANNRACEVDFSHYVVGERSLEEAAADAAHRRSEITFIDTLLVALSDTWMPRANEAVLQGEVQVALAQRARAITSENLVFQELLELTAPAAGAQGHVSVRSEALEIARRRSAAASRTVADAEEAVARERAKNAAVVAARASRGGVISWVSPT